MRGRVRVAGGLTDAAGTWDHVAELLRPFRRDVALGIFCALGVVGVQLAVPYLIRDMINAVLVQHSMNTMNRVTVLFVGLVPMLGFFWWGQSYVLRQLARRATDQLRVDTYRHINTLPLRYVDEQRVADLISRLTIDTALVATLLRESLPAVAREAARLLAGTVIVLLLNWRLGITVVLLAPLLALASLLAAYRSGRLTQRTQAGESDAAFVLDETLHHPRVVRAFGREAFETTRYHHILLATQDVLRRSGKMTAVAESAALMAVTIATIVALRVGGAEVLNGSILPGDLVASLFYLGLLTAPVYSLVSSTVQIQRAAAALSRVHEILAVPVEEERSAAGTLLPGNNVLAFDDVWFSYSSDGPAVLQGLTLEIRPGTTLALVGASGSGKTTLASLLLRYYEPTSGTIRLGEQDSRSVSVQSWRAAIGYVPQDAPLFAGSIWDNIAYGLDGATDEQVVAAARAASADSFVRVLPHGYATLVGDQGIKLSGGQRQRLAIARALIKNPRILVLDEATSALDHDSERDVQDAIERLMQDRTVIVIAHRDSTIARADEIALLDHGRVVPRSNVRMLREPGNSGNDEVACAAAFTTEGAS